MKSNSEIPSAIPDNAARMKEGCQKLYQALQAHDDDATAGRMLDLGEIVADEYVKQCSSETSKYWNDELWTEARLCEGGFEQKTAEIYAPLISRCAARTLAKRVISLERQLEVQLEEGNSNQFAVVPDVTDSTRRQLGMQ